MAKHHDQPAKQKDDEPKKPETAEAGGVKVPEWIELAKLAQLNFDGRRTLEWRLAFGFWTAIAAFTAAFFSGEVHRPSGDFGTYLWISYVIILGLTLVFWQLPLHDAHAGDRSWKHFYIEQAVMNGEPAQHAKMLKGYAELVERGWSKWQRRNKIWCAGQCLVSALFLAMSWWLITHVSQEVKKPPHSKSLVARVIEAISPDSHTEKAADD